MADLIYSIFEEYPEFIAPVLFIIGGFLLYGGINAMFYKMTFIIRICLLGYDDSGCFPEFYRKLGIYITMIGFAFNLGGLLYVLSGPNLLLIIPIIVGIIGFALYVGHVTKYASS